MRCLCHGRRARLLGVAWVALLAFGLLASSTALAAATLTLETPAESRYVRPGETVTVTLDVSGISDKNITSMQLLWEHDATRLLAPRGVAKSNDAPWSNGFVYPTFPKYDGAKIDYFIGLVSGTNLDAEVAVLTFTAGSTEGDAFVRFRPDEPPKLTYMLHQDAGGEFEDVLPVKVDAAPIVIDGTNPTVVLTAPNGGEYLKGGATATITWTTTDTNPGTVKLEYSTNSGGAWTEIASAEDDDGSYDWTVPGVDSAQCLVRVTPTDKAGNTGTADPSDAVFTIDSTDPVVAVTSPDGGEYLSGGSAAAITWTTTDANPATVKIEYSTNGGGAWTEIEAAEADDSSYGWAVPSADSSQCLVRITATDLAGNTGAADTSSATFTIDSTTPTIVVTAPDGGEHLSGGAVYAITWTTTDANPHTVKLEYSTNAGGAWTEIEAAEADDTSYDWTVPSVDSSQCLVRATATDRVGHTSASDTSDATFTIDSTDPVVVLTAPNGGEYLSGGSTVAITWTTTDANADTVKFEYSTNSGGSWTEIEAAEADDSSYDWTVPSVDSSQCLVRVTATDEVGRTSTPDASDGLFTIDSTDPVVVVTAPDGGEYLSGGSAAAITWTTTDANPATVKLEYSTNDGGAWTEIEAAETDDGSYGWAVPSADSSQCLVRITATDEVGRTSIPDTSDVPFTIDSTDPAVIVTAPNGGEYLSGGSTAAITWTTTDANPATVKLEYSTNDGGAWTEIEAAEPDDASYDWTVPAIDSAQCLVRVTATDQVGRTSAADTSDATFTIDSTDPVVVLTSPNGGQYLSGGSIHTVTWTTTDSNRNTVKLDYSTNGGGAWTEIEAAETDDGSYDWTVPSVNSDQCLVRVTATDEVGRTSAPDTSDATFTIDSTDPVVEVVSPDGGERVTPNSAWTIRWDVTDANRATVRIELSENGGGAWSDITPSAPDTGTYAWTVPDTWSVNCLVRVTATDGVGRTGSDTSDAVFAISEDPVVTVQSPNGGEFLAAGSVHTILWQTIDDDPGTVLIEFSSNGGGGWTDVAVDEADDGSYDWTVPNVGSTDCLIRVTAMDLSGGTGSDVSDAVFTIDNVDPVVALTSPNGGEYLSGGASHTITWSTTEANRDTVKLEYSINDGGSWTQIEAATPDDDSYDWTVPSVDSSLCLVRVTATDEAGRTSAPDVSDAPFTIDSTDPVVSVTAPNGGQYVNGGAVYGIAWTTTDTNPATVRIEYSANGGGAWTEIEPAETDDGSYAWTVPAVDSSQCLVRVTATDEVGRTSAPDTSDATFTIDSTDPVVLLTSPNGGEYLNGADVHTITWTTTDDNPATVKLEYSTNGGGAWTEIEPAETDDTSYGWTVPSIDSALCLVRVTATDAVGRTSAPDSSDAVFAIDSTDPAIAVVSVQQGAVELVGGPVATRGVVNIQVTASDAGSGLEAAPAVTLHFADASSTVAGYAGEAPVGTFNYTYSLTGATPSGPCEVQAHVSDHAGNEASATPVEFEINVRELTATVQLQQYTGSPGADLTLRFAFTDAAEAVLERRDVVVSFTNGRDTEVVLLDLIPEGTARVSCKEIQHFLRRRVDAGGAGADLTADFTGDAQLLGGDYNDDNFVELRDFAQFLRDFGRPDRPQTDINGDGDVDNMEFGYIGLHFFMFGDPE